MTHDSYTTRRDTINLSLDDGRLHATPEKHASVSTHAPLSKDHYRLNRLHCLPVKGCFK